MALIYGEAELDYLRRKDKRLGEAIDRIGYIECPLDDGLFASVVHKIVGQQISMAAQRTVWQRMINAYGDITPEAIAGESVEALQGHGISFRKAGYIKEFADKVSTGAFDIEALNTKRDEAVIQELSALKGIGVWTAEMLMTFCMGRLDILSFGDLAIHRGMRMLYHHRKINRALFEKYRRRYSPYGTVASLYLWAISNGAIPGMKDYAPAPKKS